MQDTHVSYHGENFYEFITIVLTLVSLKVKNIPTCGAQFNAWKRGLALSQPMGALTGEDEWTGGRLAGRQKGGEKEN